VPTSILVMHPSEFVRAWSPENGRLRLPVSGPYRVGARAAFEIRLAGTRVRATVTGAIRSVWREQDRMGIDLVLDAEGLRAAHWLAGAARGEVVPSRERAPRHRAELPVVIVAGGPENFTVTLNVSMGGCALRWPGQPPTVGRAIALRLGANSRAPVAHFSVRWVGHGRPRRVGLQLTADSTSCDSWAGLIESSGQRPKG
jgi:hypothetical protein